MSLNAATLNFRATDVTGMHAVEVTEVPRDLPAGAVARSLAARMSLPDDVPWALRSDSSSAYLTDDVAIGDQIETDTDVTVFPRSHLGGGNRG